MALSASLIGGGLVAGDGVTSFEVRAEFEDRLERDLLGPWDGPVEELPRGTSPAERYVLGRLVPRNEPAQVAQDPDASGQPIAPVEDDPTITDARAAELDGDSEDGDAAVPVAAVRSGGMAASALGLSFLVPASVNVVVVEASWGRYERAASETQLTETGRPARVWKRQQAGGQVEVRLDAPAEETYIPDAGQDGIVLRALVRSRGGRRVVDLALVNELAARADVSPDLFRIYQVALRVTALDGESAVFLGNNDPEFADPAEHVDPERAHLALLHRRTRKYASGRQCAVDADVRADEIRAWRLTTTCFPVADVRLTVPAEAADLPNIELDMNQLGSAELGRDSLVRHLRPLVNQYRQWLTRQEARVGGDQELLAQEVTARSAIAVARETADRLERAIELLRTNGIAREAFRFANQAMALQRVRSEVVRQRTADPSKTLDELLRKYNRPQYRSWRPFQLAFVLLCLPGLTDPTHPDAHRGIDDGEVELLFFPTGGGKTEAYLGLAAYTFAIRRLQGVVGEGGEARDGSDGVAVLMRYTLRLLTAQQFARASALLCACEWLRRERLEAGDTRWGSTPFRIGLWVGNTVTPGSFEDAREQVQRLRQDPYELGGPLQLAACPWCGHKLDGGCFDTDGLRRRVLLYCGDPDGRCLFSRRNSPGEGLPVLTDDEEIYRLAPALVIGTVDKFAQLPWYDRVATLFGGVDRRCTRHGWKAPAFASFCRDSHPAKDAEPAARTETVLRPRPPDLIIQDELHLISDALGSLVGLYETAIDLLCTRTEGGRVIRPVVVASTATVRRAADQVEQVFARGLTVFPPPVLDAGDTFFSRQVEPTPSTPSRRYRGMLASGARMASLEIRVAAAVLEHAQYLFDRYGDVADPYMTLVNYFTSTRDLASMRRLVEDDIADRLRSRQVRTRRRRPRVQELTSRMPSSRITATLAELERVFDPAFDTSAAQDELRARARAGHALPDRQLPMDVLLATSMLQVGVDVQRLGLMLVTGQPKNTAEYIQATSRVGRDRTKPGLVVTLFQWNRPRDLAHYEGFGYDHATFGARVEGLTTTPFSERALDRGLTGVLVAALRHASPSHLPNPAADTIPLAGAEVDALVDRIVARAEAVTHSSAVADDVRAQIRRRLDDWKLRRERLESGRLGYITGVDLAGLLREPNDPPWDRWSAPMSMREVEPEVALQLQSADPSTNDPPSWDWSPSPRPQGAPA